MPFIFQRRLLYQESFHGLHLNCKWVQEMDLYVTLAYAIQLNQNRQSAVSSNHQLKIKYNLLLVLMLDYNLTSGSETRLCLHILS